MTTGLSTCTYRVAHSHGHACDAATVTINTGSAAFTDFNRWVDESVQNSGTTPGGELAPIQINGVGLLADWVPGKRTFETATTLRWVAIFLTCPHPAPRDLVLAEALARPALRAK